jgi:5-hydroxyisourate hydrolase
MSTITTHILDTAKGCPAEGVMVILYRKMSTRGMEEVEMGRGYTNKEGRIVDWGGADLSAGVYKIKFETKDYFDKQAVPTFYPFVEVNFETTVDGHYHIPLLISPFGYSTYRGS